MIYLDYAANTPVEKDVLKEYVNATTKYIANPNSTHPLGTEAKKIIENYFAMVDGKEYDYSVQGRLNRLQRKLTN